MKLWNYIVIMLTMMIFLEFLGIVTGISIVLDKFNITINPNTHELVNSDIVSSTFYGWIFASAGILMALSAGGAIIVGLFAKSYDPSLVVLPAIISVGTLFAGTFYSLISYVQDYDPWATKIIALIMLPLAAGFLWSCVEFFRGVD